jgi:arylsulfatase A-like enzyme
VKKIRTSKNKQNLNESQIRSLYNRVEGYLFDEIVKVPLILFIPGQKSGIFNEQISALDIIPTLFELLDIDYSNELNGQSLLPLINNLEWNEKPVYFETSSASPTKKGDAFGVRTSKFKYFRHRSNLQSRYLFDLKNDPLEQNNLVLSDENQSKKMEKLLKSFILLSSEKEKIHSSIKKKQWGF